MSKILPTVLTIAGSDSGGGAGIQADTKTITCLDCFAITAITALTAQNGLSVDGIFPIPPYFVKEQLKTLFKGFTPASAKTGMLFSSEIILAVAEEIQAFYHQKKHFPLVVDPVCVSQTGHKLLEESAIASLIGFIIPLATVLTPNKPEAECLTNMTIETKEDIHKAGKKLLGLGAKNVLIKGGHFEYEKQEDTQPKIMTDWLITSNSFIEFQQPYVETKNNHGTGCTLSAAIASFLARGFSVEDSIKNAQNYLNTALKMSFAAGLGHGSPCFKVN